MGAEVEELAQAALVNLSKGVDALRRCATGEVDPGALGELIEAAGRLRNQLDAAFIELVGAYDEETRAQVDANRQTGRVTYVREAHELLRDELRMGGGTAHGLVRLARGIRGPLSGTRQAFARGDMSYGHAVSIARTVEGVVRGGGDLRQAEDLMLSEAASRDSYDLMLWGRQLRHRLRPEELSQQDRDDRERRWLSLTSNKYDGGLDIEGHLDSVNGAIVKKAFESLLGPPAKNDARTHRQRQADALAEICNRILNSGSLPQRGGARPHITISATLETLRGDPGAPAALLDWGFPLSQEAFRSIASDADLIPILRAGNGDPLHVGRRYRTATPKQKVALRERDRGCIVPGCDRGPEWCQAHHKLRKWSLGGGTDIEGLGLACLPHHQMLDAGWRLVPGSDGALDFLPPEPQPPLFGPAVHDPPPRAAA